MKIKVLKKRKGFTLVEMVMVVTILGILSSMALMKYGKVQENAQVNADYIAASSIATAVSIAIDDKNISINEGVISLLKLKNDGYLTSIPKSQSTNEEFQAKVGTNNTDITITSDNITFYPKPYKNSSTEVKP